MRTRRAAATTTGDAVRITTAAPSLTEDLSRRTRRYLIQMSVRVVCFLGAVLIDHWTRWLLLAGAVVLPYVAVLLANAGGERHAARVPGPPAPALPAAPTPDTRMGAD